MTCYPTEPRGMAAVAKGIVKTFDNSTVMLKVGNCELLLNEHGNHFAVLHPERLSFVGFYRKENPSDNLQAALDFLTHARGEYKRRHGIDWEPK